MMALINDMKNEKGHPGEPKLVVSNNVNADGLAFAKQNSIDTFAFNVEKKEDNFDHNTTSNLQVPTSNRQLLDLQLPTTNYQLPTTNFQPPTTQNRLPTTN